MYLWVSWLVCQCYFYWLIGLFYLFLAGWSVSWKFFLTHQPKGQPMRAHNFWPIKMDQSYSSLLGIYLCTALPPHSYCC